MNGMEEVIDLENQIRQALPKAREIAAPVGPIHPLWDAIFDAEAIMKGKPTVLTGTRLDRLRTIAAALTKACIASSSQPQS